MQDFQEGSINTHCNYHYCNNHFKILKITKNIKTVRGTENR